MLRRTFLRVLTGATLIAGAMRHAISGRALAAEPVGANKLTSGTVPATVQDAVRSRNSDTAVSFILAHPETAAAAATADKASLLRLVADRECSQAVRPGRESAALTVLKPAASHSAELQAIGQGFGGAAPIKALLPGIQSAELRSILTNIVGLLK
jgi:hypothetical protein